MLSDASLYSTHRSMQIHDTELFLSTVIQRMDWSGEDKDVVMDVGCGPGNSIRQMLLPSFSRVQKVIAIDVIPEMIEFAKNNNAHEKIEYHVANIEQRQTIEKWTKQVSKVVSIYCINWLCNHREAFQNVYHVLRPGGEAALLFVLSTAFWDSFPAHIDNPKYSKYLQNVKTGVPESHHSKQGASYYRNMLKDIGFNIITCEEEERTYSYPNDTDCRAAAYSRCALSKYIPDELKDDFKEDLFQGFLKHSGRDSDGRPVLHYTVLTLLIQRPED